MKGSIGVVGGGISGVAATYYLTRSGYDVELLEQGASLGGRMASARIGDDWVALGGKNVGTKNLRAREFMESMGACWEAFDARWGLLRDGAVQRFDPAQVLASATRRDSLLWASIYLLARLSPRDRRLGGPGFAVLSALFDSRCLDRYFSETFARDLLAPMTLRMNGAETDECYVGNLGSNLGMVLSSPMSQLRDGPHPVFERFRETHKVLLGKPVDRLVLEAGRVVGVVRDNVERRYDRVVLATPASVSQRLVEQIDRELAAVLGAVRYFPVGLVVAEYTEPVFTGEVTSLVFPPGSSPLSNIGVYGTHKRNLVRYTFSGKRARSLLATSPSADELLEIAEHELRRNTPLTLSPRGGHTARIWMDGLCAYSSHQHRNERRIHARLARLPGLHVTGDYLRGAAIDTCFMAADECARSVQRSFAA